MNVIKGIKDLGRLVRLVRLINNGGVLPGTVKLSAGKLHCWLPFSSGSSGRIGIISDIFLSKFQAQFTHTELMPQRIQIKLIKKSSTIHGKSFFC